MEDTKFLDNQFIDEDRWPINRLESAVIQLLWTAVLHPKDGKQDLVDACAALEVRAVQYKDNAVLRWTTSDYIASSQAVIQKALQEMQEALLRRQVLARYALDIFSTIEKERAGKAKIYG